MQESVLVTGGSGYVAGMCIVRLLQEGYAIRATVRTHAKGEMLRNSLPAELQESSRLTFAIADLTQDAGWDAAMQGCDFVLHVASPLGLSSASTPDELIRTAVSGAQRVMHTAIDAGVRRVVMTSAANASSPTSYTEAGITDESLWTDPAAPGLIPYRRSKTLAERAAWEMIEKYPSSTTLTTILPGAVFGPVLSRENLNSVQVIGRMLRGEMPGIPNIGFEIVDVRDLADIHIKAMRAPAAANQRFLATGEFMWMAEIAETLRSALGADASRVPTRRIPDFAIRLLARFQPDLREIAVGLGRQNRHTTAKAQQLLDWQPRPARETVVDCAKSLIQWGVV